MSTSNIVPNFSFLSTTIRQDGLVNATALTTAYRNTTGIRKDVRDWLILADTKSYIAHKGRVTGILVTDLVIAEHGVGTWLHPDLAEVLAQWISYEYRDAVVALIRQTKERLAAPNLSPSDLAYEHANIKLRQLAFDMYSPEIAMMICGKSDQVVTVEKVVTEVVAPATGRCDRILTADQLKNAIAKKTGQKPKTMKQVVDKIKAAGRDDLLIPVTRHSTSEYIDADKLDEALAVVYGQERQALLKPSAAIVKLK